MCIITDSIRSGDLIGKSISLQNTFANQILFRKAARFTLIQLFSESTADVPQNGNQFLQLHGHWALGCLTLKQFGRVAGQRL